MSKLPAGFFKGNRRALRQKLSLGDDEIVLIPGHVSMQYHADQAAEFLQESNFFYLTGINEPGCLLIVGANDEILLIPDTDEFEQQWNGQLSVDQASNLSGISDVCGETEGWDKLSSRLKSTKKIYTTKEVPEFFFGNVFTNPASRLLRKKLNSISMDAKLMAANQQIAELRVIKQVPEIESIGKAIAITGTALANAFSKLKNNISEGEIDASITHDFVKAGYREAYRSIVAGGRRSCTIHYLDNNQTLKSHDLLLVDAGARVNGYAADITRTVAVDQASKRQREVIEAVAEVHDFALGIIKPGVRFIDYERLVVAKMGRQLKSLKLIDDAKDEHQIRTYFPHATSHFLGLDVHDVGAGADVEFQPNMVLTVEPGIYIPDESIGVRLEDDILVTDVGVKNLSQNIQISDRI